MKKLITLVAILCLIFSHAYAQENNKSQAEAVFNKFLVAMTNTDVETVMSLFAEDALFWGTGSKSLVTTPDGVMAYFEPVGRNEPGLNIARVASYEVRAINDRLVMISGLWELVLREQDTIVPLRVSMLLAEREGEWLIIQFHNSVVPD